MDTNFIIGLIIISIIFLFLFKNNKNVEHLEESAADACRKISSQADIIKAQWDGAAKVAGQLSPLALIVNAIKGGDNEVSSSVRNVLNESIRSDISTKIDQSCSNSSANMQSNIIDTTKCEYCNRFGCDINNVTQLNTNDVQQDCALTTAVTELMKQGSDTNAQTLAQAIQKSQGPLSGNNLMSGDTCNVVNKDISSSAYLEALARCANEATSNQSNILSNCGNATNVVQKNINKSIQDCMIGTVVDTTIGQTSTTDLETKIEAEQTAIGMDTTASIIASIISSSSICLVIGLVLFAFSRSKQGKQMMSAYA